jgi:hypothetical protein
VSKPIQRRVLEWLLSGESGASSEAIACAMLKIPRAPYLCEPPWNSEDFGRCRALIYLVPEWRPPLGRVARAYPNWKPYIDRWDQLTALAETRSLLKLDRMLDAAREEADAAERWSRRRCGS